MSDTEKMPNSEISDKKLSYQDHLIIPDMRSSRRGAVVNESD